MASARNRISRASGTDRLDRLRARIQAMEGGSRLPGDVVPLGIPDIDLRLPGGGIGCGLLHEVIAGDAPAGAATAFAAVLLARLASGNDGTVLWCLRTSVIDSGEIHGPGLSRFGLDPAHLLVVRARSDDEALWTMEEGLRCRDLTAVLGEIDRITLTGSRRLQLAAETSGTTALLLRPACGANTPTASVTCWRVAPVPSRPCGFAAELGEPGTERWRAELVRCRGGASGAWLMEWHDETGDLALSAPFRDRPAEARRAAAPS